MANGESKFLLSEGVGSEWKYMWRFAIENFGDLLVRRR